MKQHLMLPTPETLAASASPLQVKNKLTEIVMRTRSRVASGGTRHRSLLAGGFACLAAISFAAAVFAPPGAGASLLAMLATASLLGGVYYVFEFEPNFLKQAVLLLEQELGRDVLKPDDVIGQKLAAEQVASIHGRALQQAKDLLAGQGSLGDLTGFLGDAAAAVRSRQEAIQSGLTADNEAVEAAEKECARARAVFEERTRHWWPARLVPAKARVPASDWITALQKATVAKLNRAAHLRAVLVCEELGRALGQEAQIHARSGAEVLDAASQAHAQLEVVRQHQNLTGVNKHFPLQEEIEELTKEAVVAKASAIRHAIAARASELTYAEAACAQAGGIVTALEGAGHLPQDFAQWWARRNGDKALLLKQLDLQSLEFATAEKKPGSAPIRHRFLLAQGGESSPACKDVAKNSRNLQIRAVDHPRTDEFVCVTESRFEPCSEMTEYLEAERQFQSLPLDKRAQMIVEVEDDAELLCYSPESAQDPVLPVRLLCVGLALGLVQRTGAECYRLVDENDPNSTLFAKGFDQAVDALATDPGIARMVGLGISRICSQEGVEVVCERLITAKKANLVPAAAGKRFRDALDEACRQLGTRPLPIPQQYKAYAAAGRGDR